ncbi:MAG TPA: cbb3-type cytochrome c oxidase subunit II [Opitutaceae bacterium]|nr:cbb3-type cytochrome c oxidase subunit II [Opitutaceae bacterium]
MRHGPLFFLGLLSALLLSWAGLVLASHAQLGALAPYFDDGESSSFPSRTSGIAARGQLVYADLGCAACHTQQVRRPDFGSDKARGWGDRQSVARDYIFQARPQLGASRFGPDLANLAARKPSAPDAEDLLKLLYAGSPTHPSYKFLFEEREIHGERSAHALRLTGNLSAPTGHEVVPTERAQTLVAHLLSLNQSYVYPEARPLEKKEGAGHGAPPAKVQDKGTPVAQPEKKAEAKQ